MLTHGIIFVLRIFFVVVVSDLADKPFELDEISFSAIISKMEVIDKVLDNAG